MDSVLKWHGGKFYLARRIVELMPPHLHYVEPYFGSGAVMLAKDPEGVSEVANDLDERLMNFWGVLRDGPAQFVSSMQATPFSEQLFRRCLEKLETPCDFRFPLACINCAACFFVVCRQSMAGRMESFAPLSRRRTRRGMNEQASAWMNAVEGLPEVAGRLMRVVLLSRPALEVIQGQDGADTLFYLDPPYLHETRSVPSVYAREMSDADHFDLLETIRACKGKVMLSGYRSPMYDERLSEWNRHDWDLPNHAASVLDERALKRRMTESLWCNF